MKKTRSLVLSVLVLPGALFSSVCSLKTSLWKLALPCQNVSIIALEVSRNVLVLESPLVKSAVDIASEEEKFKSECLLTCLLPLAAADSFVDLFTVSQ